MESARSVSGIIEQLIFGGLRCVLTNDHICESVKTSDEERHPNLFCKKLRNIGRVLSSSMRTVKQVLLYI